MVERTNFGKLREIIDPPDLIDVQTRSYCDFLQRDQSSDKRKAQGLQSVFSEVFPIESYDGRYVLDFVKYELSDPKLDPVESVYEGQTFAAPLHVTFRLKDGDHVTEDVVYMLNGLGIKTGIDLDALAEAGWFISDALGREPVSRVSLALRAKAG